MDACSTMLLHFSVISTFAVVFLGFISLLNDNHNSDGPDCFLDAIRMSELRRSSFHDAESDPNDTDIDPDVRAIMLDDFRPPLPDLYLEAIQKAMSGNATDLSRFRPADLPPPQSNFLNIFDTTFNGPIGPFTTRTFRPIGPAFPWVLLYIHGGGWVSGSVSKAQNTTMYLAQLLYIEVISVEYSRSPEAAPGIALEECLTVWRSIPRNRTVFVMGDSAGGNLAAGLILKLCDAKEARLPAAAILMYPVTDLANQSYFSWRRFAKGYRLGAGHMRAYISAYVRDPGRRFEPWFSPIYGDLSRFPPTLVLAAQFDILRDEGRAFAVKLSDAGRKVRYRCVEGTVHGFFYNQALRKPRATVEKEITVFVRSVLPQVWCQCLTCHIM
jgi:acetyl esterase